ncbi:Potassium voltage-gated channel sub H member 7 [Blyttiomyces sp. JEL0837]|nr:Potassium voltage-gated channel sub H member 7 [Blyttiomyces sp. JEL0837]
MADQEANETNEKQRVLRLLSEFMRNQEQAFERFQLETRSTIRALQAEIQGTGGTGGTIEESGSILSESLPIRPIVPMREGGPNSLPRFAIRGEKLRTLFEARGHILSRSDGPQAASSAMPAAVIEKPMRNSASMHQVNAPQPRLLDSCVELLTSKIAINEQNFKDKGTGLESNAILGSKISIAKTDSMSKRDGSTNARGFRTLSRNSVGKESPAPVGMMMAGVSESHDPLNSKASSGALNHLVSVRSRLSSQASAKDDNTSAASVAHFVVINEEEEEQNALHASSSNNKGLNTGTATTVSAKSSSPNDIRSTPELAQRNSFNAFLLDYVCSAMYDEWGESLLGTIERDFHLANIRKTGLQGIHPNSVLAASWGILMLVVVSFQGFPWPETAGIFVSTLFFIDIGVKLCTLEIVDAMDALATHSFRESQLNYMKGSLLIDIIAAFPFFNVMKATSHIDNAEVLLLIPLIYVRDLTRIYRHNPYNRFLGEYLQKVLSVGSSFGYIMVFGTLLIVFLHYHACLIFFVGRVTHYQSDTWQKEPLDRLLANSTMIEQYSWALFASFANTFPVTGYTPHDTAEQFITVACVLTGAIIYAALVGTISSFTLGLDPAGRKFRERLDDVNEFMEHRKLTGEVKHKIRQFYKLKHRGKLFDKEAILSDMNKTLRKDLAIQDLHGLISKVPFLRRQMNDGRDEAFIAKVAISLHPEFAIPGEIIFEEGEVGREMYFIYKGFVEIIVQDKSYTTLYTLSLDNFMPILTEFADVSVLMHQVYKERLEKINLEKRRRELEAATNRAGPDSSTAGEDDGPLTKK